MKELFRVEDQKILDSKGNIILEVPILPEGVKPSGRKAFMESLMEIITSKNSGAINENAQLGDKVLHKGQRGFVIGETSNGDLIIQIQGSTSFAKQNEVKVLNVKPKVMELPFKFDEKTQKVLFEQFVKCGIYMGSTPVKTSGCYVKYSQWKDARLDESINVFSDGESNIIPKENVRVYEDPNDFANLSDYVEGVIIDELSENATESVLINAIDYASNIGGSEGVRVIRGHKTDSPELQILPKSVLKTLSV